MENISFKEFAERLKVAFPALSAVTVKPYCTDTDPGLDEFGFPYLVIISLYDKKGRDEILSWNGDSKPEIWNIKSGWSTSEGFITDIPLCIRERDAGGEMVQVPVDIDAYLLPDGTFDWRNAFVTV